MVESTGITGSANAIVELATLDVAVGGTPTALSLEGSEDEKRISWCRLRPKLSPAALCSERTEVVAALED